MGLERGKDRVLQAVAEGSVGGFVHFRGATKELNHCLYCNKAISGIKPLPEKSAIYQTSNLAKHLSASLPQYLYQSALTIHISARTNSFLPVPIHLPAHTNSPICPYKLTYLQKYTYLQIYILITSLPQYQSPSINYLISAYQLAVSTNLPASLQTYRL